MDNTHVLHLDLDDLYAGGYYYTEYKIGGDEHSIYIKESDREAFLDAFATEWRSRAARRLTYRGWEYSINTRGLNYVG